MDTLADGEELEYDRTAYHTLHRLAVEWPCLSFDILPDLLGAPRTSFPHTLSLVTGTQAGRNGRNYLAVMNLSRMGRAGHGPRSTKASSSKAKRTHPDADDHERTDAQAPHAEDEDMNGEQESDSDQDDLESDHDSASEDDDDDDEDPPLMQVRRVEHSGGVNRIRNFPQQSGVVAVWSDTGRVSIFDLREQASAVADTSGRFKEPKGGPQRVNPKQTFGGHNCEGWSLDWSPVVPGRLVSGDMKSRIFLWEPHDGGKWSVEGQAFTGHTASVEDLQWSPTEPGVFMSGSVDQSLRVWDVRDRKSAKITVNRAHDADVNVISWNRLAAYMLASGGDDGALKIWDLRMLSQGGGGGGGGGGDAGAQPVADFRYQTQPITSVEWCPYESSMLASTGAEHQCCVWVSVESVNTLYPHAQPTHPVIQVTQSPATHPVTHPHSYIHSQPTRSHPVTHTHPVTHPHTHTRNLTLGHGPRAGRRGGGRPVARIGRGTERHATGGCTGPIVVLAYGTDGSEGSALARADSGDARDDRGRRVQRL